MSLNILRHGVIIGEAVFEREREREREREYVKAICSSEFGRRSMLITFQVESFLAD